ncbi:MAG: molybdopterin cofactor-binding domain-containing protein [Ilumatobacteraceae bacterium]
MSLQIVLALATVKLAAAGERRPIAPMWSREESIVGHHKRHRGRIHTRWGATADGRICAVEATVHLDAGAYNYTSNKVLGNCHLSVAGPVRRPQRPDRQPRGVHQRRARWGVPRLRGPQGVFVAESQMNKLAAELGLDLVEIRRRNVLRDGSIGITQTPLPDGVTIAEVVDHCASTAGWDEPIPDAPPLHAFASLPSSPTSLRRGRGFACALSERRVQLRVPGTVRGEDRPSR